MGPIRGHKRKRKVEKKDEEKLLDSGSAMEGSADWWDVLPKKIASMLSFSLFPVGFCFNIFQFCCFQLPFILTGCWFYCLITSTTMVNWIVGLWLNSVSADWIPCV